MDALAAYFLGIITILLIFVPFWYISRVNVKVAPVYKSIFCGGLAATNVNRSTN